MATARVVLIKVGALGDVVRTTSILPGLRRRFPDLELTWITSKAALEVVRHVPGVSRAVAIDELTTAWLRMHAFDWVVSLDDELESCRVASSLRAATLSGAYVNTRGERAYTPDTALWFGMGRLRPDADGGLARANELKRENGSSHAAILYRMLNLPPPVEPPSVAIPSIARRRADTWWREHALEPRAAILGLNTGAGGRWEFKRWGERESAELAAAAHDRFGVRVIAFGGAAEAERNRRIVADAARPGVIAAPTDLGLLEFADFLRRCSLLVTSDSLALHLALATATPVVAFFGPTSAAEVDLFGSRGEKVVTPLACRGCYLTRCDKRPHCMTAIPVESMLDTVSRWLPAPTVRL